MRTHHKPLVREKKNSTQPGCPKINQSVGDINQKEGHLIKRKEAPKLRFSDAGKTSPKPKQPKNRGAHAVPNKGAVFCWGNPYAHQVSGAYKSMGECQGQVDDLKYLRSSI